MNRWCMITHTLPDTRWSPRLLFKVAHGTDVQTHIEYVNMTVGSHTVPRCENSCREKDAVLGKHNQEHDICVDVHGPQMMNLSPKSPAVICVLH